MDSSAVAELIKNEHPQIIATILVHLDRDQASENRRLLHRAFLRNDVLLRIATLDGIQPAALRELDDVLTTLLSGSDNLKRSPMGGIRTAAEILNFMSSGHEESVLENVRQYNVDLAQKIVDQMFVFEKPARPGRPRDPVAAEGNRVGIADRFAEGRGARAAAEVPVQHVAAGRRTARRRPRCARAGARWSERSKRSSARILQIVRKPGRKRPDRPRRQGGRRLCLILCALPSQPLREARRKPAASAGEGARKDSLSAYQRWEDGVVRTHDPTRSTTTTMPQPSKPNSSGCATPRMRRASRPATWPARRSATRPAYDQGYEQGLQKGQTLMQAEARRFAGIADAFRTALDSAQGELAESLVSLALDIARQVVRQQVTHDPAALLGARPRGAGRRAGAVGCAPSGRASGDLPVVETWLKEELDARGWRISTDTTLRRGGCRAHAATGEVDATLDTRWERVSTALGKASPW